MSKYPPRRGRLTRSRRTAALVALTGLALLATAGPAAAHVTVNPDSAEQGSFAKVAFRVPNERDDAGTTKLQVDLPAGRPVAFVSVRPVPGWKVKVEESKLATPLKTEDGELTRAVSRITWSGGKVAPGQFEEFDVSMGPLPTGVDRMVFKAVQTYSNGEVVKWDQDPGPAAGGQEPEHPAPVLKLTPKGAAAAGGAAQRTGLEATAQNAAAAKAAAASADDGTARTVAWLGLAAGLVGLALGGFALIRNRSGNGSTS